MKDTKEKTIDAVQKKINKEKKGNIKLYKWYEPFAWDLLFYYVVEYLFLAGVKGYSSSQIILLTGIYLTGKLLFQIPGYVFVSKYGKKIMLVVGNLSLVIYLLLFMFAPNFFVMIVAEIFFSSAFCFKDACESDLLYDSLPDVEHKGNVFSKIEGQTNGMHYIINMISSLSAGYLYTVNQYFPLILALIVAIYCLFLSLFFKEICKPNKVESVDKELKEMKTAFRAIRKSHRLKDLIIFDSIILSMFSCFNVIRNIVLLNTGTKEEEFGMVFALLQIVGAFTSSNAEAIHSRCRNRTLRNICLPMGIAFLISGLLMHIEPTNEITAMFAVICVLCSYFTRGAYYVLIKKYLKNFTDARKREKIATAKSISNNIVQSTFLIASSLITYFAGEKFAVTIIGGVFLILMILQLDKMRFTVGKKPEEYPKSDIL